MKKPYQKQWLPVSAQLERLKNYGLIVPSGESAKRLLRHLNYYRFSGYGLAFERTRHLWFISSLRFLRSFAAIISCSRSDPVPTYAKAYTA